MSPRLLIGATAIAALLATPALASADDHRRGGPGYKKHRTYVKSHRGSRYDSHRGRSYRHGNDDGEDVALLIGGAILGYALNSAINSGSRNSSYYSEPSYGYAQPTYNYAPPPSYGYAPPPANYGYADPGYGYADPGYGYAPQPNYVDRCQQVRGGRTATGAIIGGVVGGLVGNGVAASKNRSEGTAVGAVLGSVVGGSIGSSSAECGRAPAPSTFSNAGYGGWRESGYLVPAYANTGAAPNAGYGYDQGYGDQGYGADQNYNQGYGYGEEDLYGGPTNGSQGCEISYRVTQYPDGREIREPIEVCPDGRGGWMERY